jgi:hypothetical protein
MKKTAGILLISLLTGHILQAQEIQAKVTVNTVKVGSGVDRRVFQSLQTSLITFINNRKWSDEAFLRNEKIECNFIIAIDEVVDASTFKATLSIQAARPVYNTAYNAPLINFVDNKVAFKYVEFGAIDFNDNRVQGSDALTANLPATLAYYIYIILGMDFDSFSIRAGDPYYQKAQNIVNNAPDSRSIEGWKAFDGPRSRYWLSENFSNSRYALIHDVIYNYYRKGLDFMYENEQQTRSEFINCLVLLNNLQQENAQNMIIPFFMQARSQEFINVLKKGTPAEKTQALEYLKVLDIPNSNKYKQELK